MMELLKDWFERYLFLIDHDPVVMVVWTLLLVALLSFVIHFFIRRRLIKRILKNLPTVIGDYRDKTVTAVMDVAEETISGRPELKSKTENMPWPVYFRFLRYVTIKTIDSNPRYVLHHTGLARLFGRRKSKEDRPLVPPSNEILESWWKLNDRKEYGHCRSCGSGLTLDSNILKCPSCGETYPPLLTI
jgi:hypothetical protein